MDHSVFDALLRKHVDDDGWVDYVGLQKESKELDQYIDTLRRVQLGRLDRNEKLALLINAYNAFTLRLILDHYPIKSIKDIPSGKRWKDRRWRIDRYVWSLDQIEHQQIRPKFQDPRVHFALVCAAVGCPKLRSEAYTGDRVERQLEEQAAYVHGHGRWFQYDPDREIVLLTKLYRWYPSDFEHDGGSVLEYAARYSADLRKALDAGGKPGVRWLDYDWSLNGKRGGG